ncbi:MAG: hypothetical protein HY392_04065 [Candidatus Diapherotrites archaeon]|nr:hypothetical protein [Candidatus Diapherotrites archaeon]
MVPFKTVLCDRDNTREDLCIECKKKLSSSEITELEVVVSRALGKISKNAPITNAQFHRAIELEDVIVLLCSGNLGSFIGKQGRSVAELSKILGKKARIIENTKNEKKTIQDLIGSCRIIGIEKKFAPGSTQTVIHILKEDENKLSASRDSLEKGLERVLGAKTTINFA